MIFDRHEILEFLGIFRQLHRQGCRNWNAIEFVPVAQNGNFCNSNCNKLQLKKELERAGLEQIGTKKGNSSVRMESLNLVLNANLCQQASSERGSKRLRKVKVRNMN
jgi:hypothetical protein